MNCIFHFNAERDVSQYGSPYCFWIIGNILVVLVVKFCCRQVLSFPLADIVSDRPCSLFSLSSVSTSLFVKKILQLKYIF